MAWFIIACVTGFLSCLIWEKLNPPITRGKVLAFLIGVTLVVIAVGQWLIFVAPSNTTRTLLVAVESDRSARLLLGFILGIGLGYVRQSSQAQSSSMWLTVSGAVVLLGVALPHLDSWLSHLSGLKTAFIEIQLTKVSAASKSVQPSQRE